MREPRGSGDMVRATIFKFLCASVYALCIEVPYLQPRNRRRRVDARVLSAVVLSRGLDGHRITMCEVVVPDAGATNHLLTANSQLS